MRDADAVDADDCGIDQWYELAAQMMSAMSFGPFALVPHMQCRPAAADEVAEVVAQESITAAQASGRDEQRVVEVAGPEILDLVAVAKSIADQKKSPRWVFGINVGGAAIRNGGVVPDNPDVVTSTTLPAWVAAEYPAPVPGGRRCDHQWLPGRF